MSRRPEGTRSPRARVWWFAAIATVSIAAAGSSWYALARDHHRNSTADAAMAVHAGEVMPFDLNRTRHTFTKTGNGGVQNVVVMDASDVRDLDLIRSHLRTEAENFRRGNYSDPAKIHGMDMPGVNELEHGAARVRVEFKEIAGGAQIKYTSAEPVLIAALHAWFDRQAGDHGLPGMGG